jgi:hypothetical protein
MLKHPYTNPKADGADSTIARPGDWNDNHLIGDMLTNANASTIQPGSPVYCSAAGAMNLAKADAAATAECIGLAWLPVPRGSPASVPSGALGLAQEIDSLPLTTAQWDVVTGAVGGLTPGARYYVSATTAGMLTTTAPSAVGQFIVPVGIALSTTVMRLRLQSPIGL